MGGASATTGFTCLDMDSNYNIVAGGFSSDSSILSSSNAPNPLVVYISNGGVYKWAK